MRFDEPLVPATLERRYKRFLADMRLGAEGVVAAHCANPGSMLGLAQTGAAVLLSQRAARATRRLRYTWEAERCGRTWVCVNTARANQVALEALRARRIRPLARYSIITPEVKVSAASRIDFLLRGPAPDAFIEVKSVTLRIGAGALFPDAVTERGRRHLEELARLARRGRRAVLLFLVMRDDCRWVGPAEQIDARYADTLRSASRQGVEVLAYAVRVSARGLQLGRRLPVRIAGGRARPYGARRDTRGSATPGGPLVSPRLARKRKIPAATTARAIQSTPQKSGGRNSSRDIA